MEIRLTHLGFIQAVITRMAANSFLLKGWSVTLVAAMFALSAKDTKAGFVALAYFPVFMFWFLDAYFLRQEKLYRELYKAVAEGVVPSEKMTLDASVFSTQVATELRLAFQDTLLIFHGTIAGVVLLVMFCYAR